MCQIKYVICLDINEQVNPGSKIRVTNVPSILLLQALVLLAVFKHPQCQATGIVLDWPYFPSRQLGVCACNVDVLVQIA